MRSTSPSGKKIQVYVFKVGIVAISKIIDESTSQFDKSSLLITEKHFCGLIPFCIMYCHCSVTQLLHPKFAI